MPYKPLRPCSHPGCPALTSLNYCPSHIREANRYSDRGRGSSNERGYTYKWQGARLRYLKEHPLCVECLKDNRVVAANEVDHITPHRGNMTLFWDKTNWQSLCSYHHKSKTAKEG